MGSLNSPELNYLPYWVTTYPRFKDIGLKGGQIWKINNILKIMQRSGLKMSQNLVQIYWNELKNVMGSPSSPELIYLPSYVTIYPRYKGIGSKGG